MAAPQTAVVMAPAGIQAWNENDSRYKCFCQTCHVKTGVMVIGVVEAVLVALSFISNISGEGSSRMLGRSMISVVIWLVVLGCLLYGLRSEKATFLLPHLVVQVIAMVGMVVIMIVVLVAIMANGDSIRSWMTQYGSEHGRGTAEYYKLTGTTWGFILLTIFGLALVLEIWFFMVILGCYRYFKDKEQHKAIRMNAGFSGSMGPSYTIYAPYPYPGQEQPPPYNDYGVKK